MTIYESDNQHIPPCLKTHDHWVLWGVDGEERKRPLAPWLRGDLYPARWGSDADVRPETDWETAYEHYKHRHQYAAPSGIDIDAVLPAPLLLHDPLDPPLMQVDFDDVRDPETGVVTDEVASIVDRLGGYCEISQSGTGLHVFVRAELPGGLGKFIEPLEDDGEIEMYDHGRAVGATWRHVEGTPTDRVPKQQDVVTQIIKEYESESTRKRRVQYDSQADIGGADISGSGEYSNDSSNDRSPYFDVDIRNVANTGHFQRYGDGEAGPHPGHGPQHSDPEDCTNFAIEHHTNQWYCFAHQSGGRAIELAAVLCDETDIDCDDVLENAAQKGWLRGKPQELLKTCLWMREQGVVGDEARPPYDALVATAELVELHMRDAEEGILGEANAEIAEDVYHELSLADT
jgi:hypothetical protein